MTIQFMIEGPKGSGKSTLAGALASDYHFETTHFSGSRKPDHNHLNLLANSNADIVVDRFYLSYHIYGFVQDAYQRFDIDQTSTDLILKTWSPITIKDFIEMINQIQLRMIILYSSDYNLLLERLQERKEKEGKGYTQQELNELYMSNIMFKQYSEILKEASLDERSNYNKQDIIAIDIAEGYSIEQMKAISLGILG